jgi:hypothetical protein
MQPRDVIGAWIYKQRMGGWVLQAHGKGNLLENLPKSAILPSRLNIFLMFSMWDIITILFINFLP